MAQYTIGELCEVIKGNTSIQKAVPGEYPLVVTAENRQSCNEYQFDTKAVCVPLVSSTGHGHASIKRVHYQEGKFALGSILAAIIPKDESFLMAEYLYIYLSYMKDRVLVPLMKGSANVSLTVKSICSATIEVPSVENQKRIIDLAQKVDENGNNVLNLWVKQLEDIKTLRQSILREAVQGKLVPQDLNDEPASQLLNQIREDNQRLSNHKKVSKQPELPPINEKEILFQLPNNWEWVRLGEVCLIKGGKRLPVGHNLLETPTGRIYIRVTDMKNYTIDDSDLHYISDEVYEQIKDYIIEKDDLYIVIVGSTIGKVGIVPEKFHKMNLTENAARIILHKVDKKFLLYVLASEVMQEQFVDKTNQLGQPKLALIRLKQSLLPLPPLVEQKRISEKVSQLMAYCDQLEVTITQEKQDCEILLQSVLQEAFTTRSEETKVENLGISLGEFVKLRRETMDITVTNMVKMLGNMKLSEYSCIEAGITEPNITIKKKISSILELDSSQKDMFFRLPVTTSAKNSNNHYPDNIMKIAARRSQ